MRSDTFKLEAHDGRSLHAYRWLPDDEPRAIFQISHGIAEHCARYARFAEVLTGSGYAVYAHDARGHGETATDDDDLGHPGDEDGWANMVRDIKTMRDHAVAEHPGLPNVLFGHSMGATLSMHFLFTYPGDVAACALSGCSLNPGALGHVGIPVAKLIRGTSGKRGKSKFLDDLAFKPFSKPFKPNRTTHDWLSRDNDEVDKYVADRKCGFVVTNEMWVQHVPAIFATYDPANHAKVDSDTALLLYCGEKDPAADNGKSVRQLVEAFKKASLRRVQYKIYPDGRHEMHNETNRDEVMGDVVSWLEEVLEAKMKKAA